MYISKLNVHDFRAFQDSFDMELGRYITVISGLNGIGKSTLLAILTNSSELKTNEGKLLNNEQFTGDFRDIVMYDEKNDTSGDKVIIYFEDLPQNSDSEYVRELTFRATRQGQNKNKITYRKDKETNEYKKIVKNSTHYRYRLIPKKEAGKWSGNAKVKWPSYYLGLSRIYPVGETENAKKKDIPDTISKKIVKKHEEILSEHLLGDGANYPSFQNLNIDNVKKSKSGIETSNYGATSNSSGQDNLGQILLTLASFEELKKKLGDHYYGGILAIDELDATLHPAAQNKLFDWLFKRAKDLQLQIVFTTHSLSLLEHASNKINEKGIKSGEISINYLITHTDIPGHITVKYNPNPDFFRYNLTQTYATNAQFSHPVNIIMEDEIARNFCKLIFKNSIHSELADAFFPEVNISWNHIINLVSSLPSDFNDALIILDPDKNPTVSHELTNYLTSQMSSLVPNNPKGNLFILPGDESIEMLMWNYAISLDSDHDFYKDEFISNNGFDYEMVRSTGIQCLEYKNDKNKYKHWFKDHIQYMKVLEKNWIIDNKQLVSDFCNNVFEAYKRTENKLKRES